jgi:hypothetical protein
MASLVITKRTGVTKRVFITFHFNIYLFGSISRRENDGIRGDQNLS